eukprot:1156632-Pelagomonas_calceolata.AAC.10
MKINPSSFFNHESSKTGSFKPSTLVFIIEQASTELKTSDFAVLPSETYSKSEQKSNGDWPATLRPSDKGWTHRM